MNAKMERFIRVQEEWKLRKGKNELLAHLNGETLTRSEAITAKCYECNAGYDDDKPGDCNITTCPLHQYMPYNESRNKRVVSEEQRAASSARLAANRNR